MARNYTRETSTPLPLMNFRCAPELRADLEAVTRPGETLSEVIRTALADLIETRRHDEQTAA